MNEITAEMFGTLSRLHATWIADFESGQEPPSGSQLSLNLATLRRVTVSGLNLTSASINNSRMEDCSFVSCAFTSSEIMRTTCLRCSFDHCDFAGADLRDFDASHCSFLGCNFTRADLSDARLSSADCSECIFDWAWLMRTDLRNAKLHLITMRHSRLSGTKLFNKQRWDISATDQIAADKVDLSENGDGSMLIDWHAAISRLSDEPDVW